MELTLPILLVFLATVLGFLAFALLVFALEIKTDKRHEKKEKINGKLSSSMMVIVGSGGHTSEILKLVHSLGCHYTPRYYVLADTDKMSEDKVYELQNSENENIEKTKYEIHRIPRSREVKQSWLTTVLSTLHATAVSFPLVFRLQPDIVLCNGPGTCIPLCIAAFILKIFKWKLKIVYVESMCRVETLSFSGKLLYHFADSMLVQWPKLQQKYPKTKYIGRLV